VPTQGDFVFPKKQTVASVVFQCKIICCSFLFAANIVRSDYAIPASHLASLLTGIFIKQVVCSGGLFFLREMQSSRGSQYLLLYSFVIVLRFLPIVCRTSAKRSGIK
jgi:hypothetical protein